MPPEESSQPAAIIQSMSSYKLSPYVDFIESHLITHTSQYAVAHRLTGEVCEASERVRSLLYAAKLGNRVSFSSQDLANLGEDGKQISWLVEREFLVADGHDVLSSFIDQYVVRPLQNPSLVYRSQTGDRLLVRVSMAERVYSPRPGEAAAIIEEAIPRVAAEVFLAANGRRPLSEIFVTICGANGGAILEDAEFRAAIDFLTKPERQLIKFTRHNRDLSNPYQPFNTVPRNFYHAARWKADPGQSESNSIHDFHRAGISDASWEFDVIEPTVNHAFRFPNEVLGGLDYGARFCRATLEPEVVQFRRAPLEILEVGGGTGTFARSFIQEFLNLSEGPRNGQRPNYHIMDLSPALIESQQRMLAGWQPGIEHFEQDATQFDLPGRVFDLIISNEVIADFPVATARRNHNRTDPENEPEWLEDGAPYIQKYGLSVESAPDRFFVNAGVFEFIERAWSHLAPGGTVVLSEYGSVSKYPAESFHLNHAEFSIHFGHVMECARAVGFVCRLQSLKEFLAIDDQVMVLNGREEHLRCLNHVLEKQGMTIPFAVISEGDFKARFAEVLDRIELTGISFQPLRNSFHYGPGLDDFMVLIMNKLRT
jgi:phospholipid N-methyltransferase